MDKDKVKGTMDDAAGRIKRQVGEWTGDAQSQLEGAAQQVKGKAEKALGNMKEAARDARRQLDRDTSAEQDTDRDRDRDDLDRP